MSDDLHLLLDFCAQYSMLSSLKELPTMQQVPRQQSKKSKGKIQLVKKTTKTRGKFQVVATHRHVPAQQRLESSSSSKKSSENGFDLDYFVNHLANNPNKGVRNKHAFGGYTERTTSNQREDEGVRWIPARRDYDDRKDNYANNQMYTTPSGLSFKQNLEPINAYNHYPSSGYPNGPTYGSPIPYSFEHQPIKPFNSPIYRIDPRAKPMFPSTQLFSHSSSTLNRSQAISKIDEPNLLYDTPSGSLHKGNNIMYSPVRRGESGASSFSCVNLNLSPGDRQREISKSKRKKAQRPFCAPTRSHKKNYVRPDQDYDSLQRCTQQTQFINPRKQAPKKSVQQKVQLDGEIEEYVKLAAISTPPFDKIPIKVGKQR